MPRRKQVIKSGWGALERSPEPSPQRSEVPEYLQPLLKGLKRFYETKEHTDITVTCNGRAWQAHKLCLCAQSGFFQSMFSSGKFREAQENKVPLDDDAPEIVDCLLHYLYNFDYHKNEYVHCLWHIQSQNITQCLAKQLTCAPILRDEGTPPIVFDVKMWVVANKYLIDNLKNAAASKFKRRLEEDWETDAFADAATEVYNTTPEDSILRHDVVSTVKTHSEQLLNPVKGRSSFIQVLREIAELGADIAMGGAARSLASRGRRYQCPHCQSIFQASVAEGCKFSCPRDCVEASSDSNWWEAYAIEGEAASERDVGTIVYYE